MTRHTVILAAAVGVGLCLCTAAAPSARAHHSYAIFADPCASVTIEGRIENIQWKEPHVWFDLMADDGTVYHAEWTSLSGLSTRGATPPATETLKAGDRIVVTGSRMRDAAAIRAAVPELKSDPRPNSVTALTQVRRASDGWTWTINAQTPAERAMAAGCK
jgi:hypothetical protein